MGLKLTVKASRIDNLSDARYCAGMGVDMMGFPIDPDFEGTISPDLFHAISGWISGVELIGEVMSSHIPEPDVYEVAAIEVHKPELVEEVKAKGFECILAIDLSNSAFDEAVSIMQKYLPQVKYFLLLKENADEITKGELQWIKNMNDVYPIILGFGVTPENLERIIEIGIQAISISGSSEERPGYKSYDEMADILEALEV